MNTLVLLLAAGGIDCHPSSFRPIAWQCWQPCPIVIYYYRPAPPPPPPLAEKTLYERLGGEAAVKAVVDDFVARAAADTRVNFTRKGTGQEWEPTPPNVARLKRSLVQMVGAVTGGPQKYEGRSMKDVHKGMKITGAEFDALAADLKATLDKFEVPPREQQELLKIVASTRGDIVEK
jgi:hemoglobin